MVNIYLYEVGQITVEWDVEPLTLTLNVDIKWADQKFAKK